MYVNDPKISVEFAIRKTDGNQAELGRILGVTRASVNEWVRTGREYLPPLQGYRFVEAFGHPDQEQAERANSTSEAAA